MKKLIQKSFALLVLLFGINALNAQTWFPVGGGLPGNWGSFEHVDMVSKKINNEIHVAVSVSNSTWTSSSTVIYKWNGIAWTTTSP
ncbi:MAG: hypothetical protein N4A41_09600, partial [Crocinitomicaceae bacterium]|nr:hypothetical protein [Crocinitomicaceae bacterium]